MATYYYGQSAKDSKWYFRLKDNNNETILSSTEGYNSKQSCLGGIESVKRHSDNDNNYTSFTGTDGQFYFSLHSNNYEKIGKSEAYHTAYGRDRGKENCKQEGLFASVKEAVGS
jgi:uncharacterized protein YegP (UPF0339 family)